MLKHDIRDGPSCFSPDEPRVVRVGFHESHCRLRGDDSDSGASAWSRILDVALKHGFHGPSCTVLYAYEHRPASPDSRIGIAAPSPGNCIGLVDVKCCAQTRLSLSILLLYSAMAALQCCGSS